MPPTGQCFAGASLGRPLKEHILLILPAVADSLPKVGASSALASRRDRPNAGREAPECGCLDTSRRGHRGHLAVVQLTNGPVQVPRAGSQSKAPHSSRKFTIAKLHNRPSSSSMESGSWLVTASARPAILAEPQDPNCPHVF